MIVQTNIPDTIKYNDATYSVTSIADEAFYTYSDLTKVTFPTTLKTIGNNAFEGCKGLTEVTIPSIITTIKWSAFSSCTNLKSATIGAKNIEAQAFVGCSELNYLDLQEGVTNIEDDAFMRCKSLKEVTIPSTAEQVRTNAFYMCDSLATITIKGGQLGDDTFGDCSNLKTIIFDGSMFVFDERVFAGSSNVESVIILNCELIVGNPFGAFSSAESPKSLKLPSTWPEHDRPANNTTPWHGGYFNCTYVEKVNVLGDMATPCTDCAVVKVRKGDKTIILYAPDEVTFAKVASKE